MIERDDIRAAVGAGIVTEAQAASLIALSDSRRGARENLDAGDEPFELFKGFNEIFIVVGLAILTTGWIGIVTFVSLENASSLRSVLMWSGGLGAVILWFLSEYFIRIRRMVAPAIALSVLFAANAAYGFAGMFSELFMVAQGDSSSLPVPLALATLALLAFWYRFKVPFALAIIALSVFAIAILSAGVGRGAIRSFDDLFLLSTGAVYGWITIVLGLVVFAIAMTFDMSDPHRVTRRAANGFWLHVVAAPALVNFIALNLLESGTVLNNALLIVFLAGIAAVAIVIDRRSFLIAAIGYIVILSNTVFDGQSAVFTIFALGVFLVVLGARWERIRARLLAVLPGFIPRQRLPPTA